MAADFFARIDVSTLDTTYSAAATCLFTDHAGRPPIPCDGQSAINEGQGTPAAIEVSFDGVNTAGYLLGTGAAASRLWIGHRRDRLWLRRVGAAGVGQFVQVGAWTDR